MKFITGAQIITEKKVIKGHILALDNQFTDIIPSARFEPDGRDIVDATGLFAAPGLIDVHIHGSGGKDVMEGTGEALRTISAAVAKHGVTSFLATTMTMEWRDISHALDQIRKSIKEKMPGSAIIGAHLEGPFINARLAGAQKQEFILEPDWKLIAPYKDIIKIVTLAPELQGSSDLIRKLKENNIIASLGHTAASFEEAMEGIKNGVSHCTHLFNAMTGIHHRDPGTAGAALTSGVYCELIADLKHVHPAMFNIIRKQKGSGRIILITDCMEAGGMPEGKYSLGGRAVNVNDGEARLEDGTLAGSIASLNRCVFNFYNHSKCDMIEAFNMASLNPATELNISDHKGSIAIGKDADFILIDKTMDVKATYVNGECVYRKKNGLF